MPLASRAFLSGKGGKDITNQAISDFRYVFNLFDLNNDDTIDAAQFADIIHLLGDERPSEQELRDVMRTACRVPPAEEVPTSLTFKHFLNFFAVYKSSETVHETDVFRVLDRDGNGLISSRDLARTLHGFGLKFSKQEVDAMADVASTQPDTTEFSRDEFSALSQRLADYRASLAPQRQKNPSIDSE